MVIRGVFLLFMMAPLSAALAQSSPPNTLGGTPPPPPNPADVYGTHRGAPARDKEFVIIQPGGVTTYVVPPPQTFKAPRGGILSGPVVQPVITLPNNDSSPDDDQ